MNSLNLLSSRVIGQSPLAPRPRSKSQGEILRKEQTEEPPRGRSYSDENLHTVGKTLQSQEQSVSRIKSDPDAPESPIKDEEEDLDEKSPLLQAHPSEESSTWSDGWKKLVKRITDALTAILAAIGAPVLYVVRILREPRRMQHASTNAMASSHSSNDIWMSEKPSHRVLQETKLRHSYSSDSLNSTTSDSDLDSIVIKQERSSPRIKREKHSADAPETRRSSIRIKEQNDPALKKRKQKRSGSPLNDPTPLTVDNIKSPTSPYVSLKVTRYPHAPQPPRPLIPRRQPSYSNLVPRSPTRATLGQHQQKTLVLDLDETLIHSLAKGGRMSSGHMVEVKLNAPVAMAAPTPNQATQVIGPQHPILYYVHKRPHCDEFLRKVCKWYKLVVFTASVQEYADPVIDWLEQERKYFVGRYYRQHCTFRNGSYIKDLSSIEPDLSRVIILDNSPVSYVFHEDNAIPIEGWINDPTDNDLLHLIPMLEALQYVTDVRALLALRRGETETS